MENWNIDQNLGTGVHMKVMHQRATVWCLEESVFSRLWIPTDFFLFDISCFCPSVLLKYPILCVFKTFYCTDHKHFVVGRKDVYVDC